MRQSESQLLLLLHRSLLNYHHPFYSSYVDNDWGAVDENEEAEAELEEEDARMRQAVLDKQAGWIDDGMDDDEVSI